VISFGRRLRAEEAGQSIVEFSLALPILVFGLIGGSDLARAFAIQLAIQNGARAGAEAAAVTYSGPNGVLTASRAKDEIGRTPYLNASNAVITVTFKQTDGLTDCLATAPTVAVPCYASVRVQYTFTTIIPWPVIPTSANFDRTTTMRVIAAPSGVAIYTCGPGYPAC
jgi:Flp pilus assembly protein TadG